MPDADIFVAEVKKAVVIGWDVDKIKGSHVSVFAMNPKKDKVLAEKLNELNDGRVLLNFPSGYSGKCVVELHGSSSGVLSLDFSV